MLKNLEEGRSNSTRVKRFSVAGGAQPQEKRVTVRPYESFRERNDTTKPEYSFGFAALSAEGKNLDEEGNEVPVGDSPTPSIFSIYGDDPGPSTMCDQPIGKNADVFISTLSEKLRNQLKKYLDSTPRQEHQYFMWIKEHKTNKLTVVSVKTLENHLKSKQRVRRVKWRHLSTDQISIYRYSLPAITYEKSKICSDCVLRHKKICLLGVWLCLVLFLCVIVVLGSLHPEERQHPFIHYNSNQTGLAL